MEQEHSKEKFSKYLKENQNYGKLIDLGYFNYNGALSEEKAHLIKQLLSEMYSDNLVVCKKALIQRNPTIRYDVLHDVLNQNIKEWDKTDLKGIELYKNGYAKQSLYTYAHCFEKMVNNYSDLTEHEMGIVKGSFLSTMLCRNAFSIYKNNPLGEKCNGR